jgi:hypothetical protein
MDFKLFAPNAMALISKVARHFRILQIVQLRLWSGVQRPGAESLAGIPLPKSAIPPVFAQFETHWSEINPRTLEGFLPSFPDGVHVIDNRVAPLVFSEQSAYTDNVYWLTKVNGAIKRDSVFITVHHLLRYCRSVLLAYSNR